MEDKEFLRKLDEWNEREVYVKLVSLDNLDRPIAEITGNTTQGNISIDGSSTVRRTCNITLTTT